MKSSFSIPAAIVIGGIILAVAVYVSMRKPELLNSGIGNPSLVRPVSASDHILGNPSATVFIVEYADFDCTFCKVFNDTLHQIIASEGANGNVAWVFRQFPLSEIHPNALSHARAAECAALVGGTEVFWKFADALYANQPIDPTTYGTIAASVGLTGDRFATCYAAASSTLDERILADRQNALDIGAQGAPYALILSPHKAPIVVDGAYSYTDLKVLLNQALTQ